MAASVRRGLYTRQIASTCACRLLKAGRPSERSVRREGFWRTAPSGDEIAVLKDALEKIRKEEKKKLAEEIRKEEKKKLAEEVRKEEQEKYEELLLISTEGAIWLVLSVSLGGISGGAMPQILLSAGGLAPAFEVTRTISRGLGIVLKDWLIRRR